jgi:hypothetical protein
MIWREMILGWVTLVMASEAKQSSFQLRARAREGEWIASSLSLLAMTM